jgi:rhamnulokinase
VDSWGVDYALIDESGRLVEEPVCYRDERTAGAIDWVCERLSPGELFTRTGIQLLPLNTIFQLAAHVRQGFPSNAARLLLIPDLCHHQLCGSAVTERTNASTTQLLRVNRDGWDDELLGVIGVPRSLMPEIVEPGTDLGAVQTGGTGESIRVIAPASHDTGSAVAGTPLERGWAFISSGTWSLVGVELDSPLVNAAVAGANFTNETGVSGSVRFLKNVMGLWILESCRREWEKEGHRIAYGDLVERASHVDSFAGFVFPDDPRFFNPSSMTAELRASLVETAQTPHDDPVLVTKVVLDSLALRYASVVRTIEDLTGRTVPGIHIVGGGSLNSYLNQATANAAGRPVLAGPVEAAALGNLLVQSIARGQFPSVAEGRRHLGIQLPLKRFLPTEVDPWLAATMRYEAIAADRLGAARGRT